MEIHAIVQARMTSTRLPGKVLMPVLGRPLLDLQMERLRRVTQLSRIIVATTTGSPDDQVESYCVKTGIPVFRGDEQDVLGRYYGAAKLHGSEIVVRITADCPVIDPRVVDLVLSAYLEGGFDYASNTLERSYPRGLDTEVFSFQALQQAEKEARTPHEREHVTPFLYQKPGRFRLKSVKNETDLSRFRWTVDTKEDFELIREIFERLYPGLPQFEMADVVRLMEQAPELEKINAGVNQKQ